MYICYFLLSERVCDSQISYFLLPRRWLIRRACIHQSVNVALTFYLFSSSDAVERDRMHFTPKTQNLACNCNLLHLSDKDKQLRNWCPQCLGMLLSFLKVLIILSFKITQNFRSRLVLRLSKFVLCEYFGLQSVQHNPLKFRVYTIFWDFVILFLPREQRKPSY